MLPSGWKHPSIQVELLLSSLQRAKLNRFSQIIIFVSALAPWANYRLHIFFAKEASSALLSLSRAVLLLSEVELHGKIDLCHGKTLFYGNFFANFLSRGKKFTLLERDARLIDDNSGRLVRARPFSFLFRVQAQFAAKLNHQIESFDWPLKCLNMPCNTVKRWI